MKKVLVSILLLIVTFVLSGCETNVSSLYPEMPNDFFFTLTFGFDGYYDSKTGVLRNGYNYDLDCECKTKLFFDYKELEEIYHIFLDGSIYSWDDELTVTNSYTVPSYVIYISFTANGKSKNISIRGASFTSPDKWNNSARLGKAYYKIVDEYIKSSEEFKSLPKNQIYRE